MLEVLRYIALNALNTVQKIKAMSKMSKIDKVHIRGVMLCMSKMSKMGKEHTHTFWLITSLILNGFSIRKKFWKAENYVCMLKHVKDVEDYLWHLRHALIYTVYDGMVGKPEVSAFQNFFWIENPLSIKEVMSQNVCVCSFPIFDIFDIHSITALRCIWSIFDIFNIDSITALSCIWSIFDISDIDIITALRYIWSIFNIFDIDSITFKRYYIKKVMIKMCLYVLFPSLTSSTYIALQPLAVFDLSSTSST